MHQIFFLLIIRTCVVRFAYMLMLFLTVKCSSFFQYKNLKKNIGPLQVEDTSGLHHNLDSLDLDAVVIKAKVCSAGNGTV